MPLSFRWTSIFSPVPKPRPLLGLQGLGASEAGVDGLVLGRALYRLRWVSLADVPPAERRAAVRNLCLAWQPFDDAEYRVRLQGGGALLFAWDRGLRARAPQLAQWIPESCCRPLPDADGLRVLQLSDGVEAELWQNGELRESRWWPEPPSETQTQHWLRGLGAIAEGLRWQSPQQIPLQARPVWQVLDLDALARSGSRMERLIAGVLALSLSGLAGAAGMQAWHAHQQLKSTQLALATQQRAQAPALAARNEAMQLVSQLETTQRAFALPSALAVMAHLGQVLKPGVELRELELKGSQVRLVVTWPSGQPRSGLLQDLQAGGWLRDAKELREGQALPGGQMAVEAELRSLMPQPPAAPAAGAASSPLPAGLPNASLPSGFPRPGAAP